MGGKSRAKQAKRPLWRNRIVESGVQAADQFVWHSAAYVNFCGTLARSIPVKAGTSGVYAIFNTMTGKAYIGSSVDVAKRFREHRSDLMRGLGVNKYLQAAWDKYGPSLFRFVFLRRTNPVRHALLAAEQDELDRWLASARQYGYNLCPLAPSRLGAKMSAESRRRCVLASTGRKIPNKPPQSAETKGKRRAWWLSPAGQVEKERLRERNIARRGRPWSEAQRAAWTPDKRLATAAKIGAAHKGRPWSSVRRAAQRRTE